MASLALGLLLLISSLTSAVVVVRVNYNQGQDSSSCLESDSRPCKTLRYVAIHLGMESNLSVLIETDIKLESVVVFEGMWNLTISGSSSTDSAMEIQCSSKAASLYFKNVTKVAISNIEFNSCGALDEDRRYKVALFFKSSSDISLVNITVRESHLTGIAFLNCPGKVLLESVHLFSNGYGCGCSSLPAGVSIEITDPSVVGHYMLRRCIFEGNHVAKTLHCCSDKNLSMQNGLGQGGGLSAYFSGNCSNNMIEVSESEFSANTAKWGGGLSIQFQDFTQNNTVSVQGSKFYSNQAEYSGGGVSVLYLNDRLLQNKGFYPQCDIHSKLGEVWWRAVRIVRVW